MIREVYTVSGLGFGDEGKGTIVDFLARTKNARLVIRFNGGAQAAHHVVLPDGRWHCFSQFGSGSFVPGVTTFLSKEVIIDPFALLAEADVLGKKGVINPLSRIFMDSRCAISTPYHKLLGRVRETARGENKIGSTGMGIGEVVLDTVNRDDVLLLSDCANPRLSEEKLSHIIDTKKRKAYELLRSGDDYTRDAYGYFTEKYTAASLALEYAEFYSSFSSRAVDGDDFIPGFVSDRSHTEDAESVVLEGAQGALLDPVYGTVPYVTKTPCTMRAAEHVLRLIPETLTVRNIGVMRAYAHRHGPGPLPTEDANLTNTLPETHNMDNKWQGNFRTGCFDLPASKYALSCSGAVDSVAITNLDRIRGLNGPVVCTEYAYEGSDVLGLHRYFTTRKSGDRSPKVTGWLTGGFSRAELAARTSVLLDCTPSGLLDMGRNITMRKAGFLARSDTPDTAAIDARMIDFIEYIASAEALNIPVSIISAGPTWRDKYENTLGQPLRSNPVSYK